MNIPKFAIFYANGDIVEGGGEDDEVVEIKFNVSKKWLEASNDEVMGVVVENPFSCRYVWRGQDFYFVLPTDDHEIHCSDDLQPYMRKYFKGIIKCGVCVGTSEWEKFWDRIKNYTGISKVCKRRLRPDHDEPKPSKNI